MVTSLLCIVILCLRKSQSKGTPVDDKVPYSMTELNTDVIIKRNPSYDVIKPIAVEYSEPISSCTMSYSKTNQEEYSYVQPNEFMQHSDSGEVIRMSTRETSVGKDSSITFSATTNSDTKADQSLSNVTVQQYDYSYIHDDHFLHHNATTNTGDVIEGNMQIHATVDQSHNTCSPSPYLSPIRRSTRPSDDNDATHNITES